MANKSPDAPLVPGLYFIRARPPDVVAILASTGCDI
jgi:hypothetical protein